MEGEGEGEGEAVPVGVVRWSSTERRLLPLGVASGV